MSLVNILFLGAPILERAGQRVNVDTRKAIALLAYLASVQRPVSRATLAALLWPNYDHKRAAANLRRTLWSVHAVLGEGTLEVGSDLVALAGSAAGVYVDVVEYQRLVAQTGSHGHGVGEVCEACLAPLAEAVSLVRGDFLEGFTLSDSVEFDDWQSLTTASLHNSLADSLRRLVAIQIRMGSLDAAKVTARRRAALDVLDQAAAEQLMLLSAWTGDHAGALRVYRDLERSLQLEFDASPDPTLVEIFEVIKGRRELPAPAAAAAPHAEIKPASPKNPAVVPTAGSRPAFLDSAPDAPPSIFVAREQEIALLFAHLAAACQGQGRIVFIAGEAGQGKTALINSFTQRAVTARGDLVTAGGACNAYTGSGDPYLPFRELLALLSGDVEARTLAGSLDRERALRLWHTMPSATQALVEEGADLLDTFVPLRPLLARSADHLPSSVRQALESRIAQPPAFDPTLQQASLFEQVTNLLGYLAARSPLLLALDDLQWCDAGSLALLFHLSRRLAGKRILIVAAYRPNDVALGRAGERHPLEPIIHEVQQLQGTSMLDLDQAQGRAFIDALLDSEPNLLDDAFRSELLRQTNGHPLFTSELLRGMQERGDLVRDTAGFWVARPQIDWDRLPARVEAVIAERIGRIPAKLRALLRAASVEGEEFCAEVAAQLVGMDVIEARRHLSGELSREHKLVRGLGVDRIGEARLTRYRFHHFLIQRSLYFGLDVTEQAAYNEDAANFLAGVYGERSFEIAVALAHHYDVGGLPEKAIAYYQLAGDRSLRFSANTEAANHYARALALLTALPPTPARLQQEFTLQAWYSVPIQHLEGWGSPRAEAAVERAMTLARQFGNPPATLPLLGRTAHAWVYRGEHVRAMALAQELLALAKREEDDSLLLEAHTIVGLTHFYKGEFVAAQPHLDAALALYDPVRHASLTYLYGQDAGVHAGLYRVLNLTMLGFLDQARLQAKSTIALAEEISHPFTLAFAWSFVSLAAGLALDIDMILETAQRSLAVARAHAFPTWTAFGLAANGYARGVKGEVEEGFEDMFSGLAIALPTGAQTPVAFILGLSSELYTALGQHVEAMSMLDVGIAMAEHNAEGLSIPDLYRRRGLLLLELGRPWAEADADLRRAIVLAGSQQARLHELRALTARLRSARRHAPEEIDGAHRELSSCYGWFAEGFEAADLIEARRELANTLSGLE